MAGGRLSASALRRAVLRQWPAAPASYEFDRRRAWQDGSAVGTGQKCQLYTTGTLASPASVNGNYANNILEYNKVLSEINQRRRPYLMRDVYEDMQIDGVQPVRDTFHTLIIGCMKGNRLQDAMYFFNEMKTMGLAPDIVLYNCVIATCGRCNQTDRAFQVAEEMETAGIQPKHRTFLALLNACGIAGRVEEAYGVVRRMAACGLTLNSSCYSALITAYKNKRPVIEENFLKIFELLKQSKRCDTGVAEGEGRDEFEDELANLVTGGELQPTRSYVNRHLNVYFTALRACSELGNTEAVKTIMDMLERDGHQVDAGCLTELIKCYLSQGELENALIVFDRYVESGKQPTLNLYITLIQGCIVKLSPEGMDAADRLLHKMDERGYFLNTVLGGNLLMLASNEMQGDFSTANLIWDMMLKRGLKPSFRATLAYCSALQRRKVPEEDVRLLAAREVVEKAQRRFKEGGEGGLQKGLDQVSVDIESGEEAMLDQGSTDNESGEGSLDGTSNGDLSVGSMT